MVWVRNSLVKVMQPSRGLSDSQVLRMLLSSGWQTLAGITECMHENCAHKDLVNNENLAAGFCMSADLDYSIRHDHVDTLVTVDGAQSLSEEITCVTNPRLTAVTLSSESNQQCCDSICCRFAVWTDTWSLSWTELSLVHTEKRGGWRETFYFL